MARKKADGEARIGALAPWLGSKRTLAPEIVRQLGDHRSYWDLFCGSMAVLLAKPPCSSETVNDLHGDLINLARVIRDRKLGPQLYRRLRRVWFGRPVVLDARQALAETPPPGDDPDAERAEHYFIDSWQSMNGLAGTDAQGGKRGVARRFTTRGGDPGVRWRAAVDSIPAWSRRMRGVKIERDCGIALAEKIEDRAGTVIYADPPYLEKNAAYLHDFSPRDHERLAAALCRFRATRVVVSYYDHGWLAELYPGWAKIACDAAKSMVNGSMRGRQGRTEAPEVLLVNRTETGGLFGPAQD